MILQLNELDRLIIAIKESLPDDKIILLNGTLASGKTTLVKKFATSLGITETSSPTFSIVNNYENKIYHYDLYNDGVDKFLELGLLEGLEDDVFHFIEWADEKFEKMLIKYDFSFMRININIVDDMRREYKLSNF